MGIAVTMDVLAEAGRGGTRSSAGSLLLPTEPGKFIALPLPWAQRQRLCPWDVREGGPLERLLV